MLQTGANHNVVRIDVTIHNFRFVDLVKGIQCSLYVAQNPFWSSTQYSSNLDILLQPLQKPDVKSLHFKTENQLPVLSRKRI